MAIKIRKQAAASVEIPPNTHTQFFVDTDGLPKLKDDQGNVTDAAQAGQVTLNEQGSDPVAVANKVKLYSKDVDGVAEFFARDDQGNVIQITSNGALNAGGGSGTFFDDSQSASLNQTVLTSASFSWNTGINVGTLPTNGLLVVHIETQSVSNTSRDAGFMRVSSAWNGPPALPTALPNSIPDGWSSYGVLALQLVAIGLNALGELVLDLTENKGFDTQFILKLTVSPVRTLPFPPIGA